MQNNLLHYLYTHSCSLLLIFSKNLILDTAIAQQEKKTAGLISDFGNYDLQNVQTPIKVDKLQDLLAWTKYNEKETKFLLKGFRTGFSLGYKGPMNRQDVSRNIPKRFTGPLKILCTVTHWIGSKGWEPN